MDLSTYERVVYTSQWLSKPCTHTHFEWMAKRKNTSIGWFTLWRARCNKRECRKTRIKITWECKQRWCWWQRRLRPQWWFWWCWRWCWKQSQNRKTNANIYENKVFATVLKANLLHCGENRYFCSILSLSFVLSISFRLLALFVLTLNLLTQCNLTLSRNLIIIFTHLFSVCVSKSQCVWFCFKMQMNENCGQKKIFTDIHSHTKSTHWKFSNNNNKKWCYFRIW